MKQYTKYLIHFSLIIFFIFLVFVILCFIDNNMPWWYPIIMFLCIWLIYAIPMSCIYSSKSKLIEIKLDKTEDTLTTIDSIITNIAKRKSKKKVNDKIIIYYMKGRYNKWLTPPITVELQNDSLIILTPKEFADKFNQL